MPSLTCVDFINGYYHVYNRGVNKQKIFHDDQDRWFFINLCKTTINKYEAQFLAFCLMGNHYHLFIHTPQANLSKIMKYINERFAKYYIKKYQSEKKCGHVFGGPFGRKIVQNDLYAGILLSYIHNNPVKDNYVKHPEDYNWSSYNNYATDTNSFNFINKELLSSYFIATPKDTEGKAIIDKKLLQWNPDKEAIGNLILGNVTFAKQIYQQHFQSRISEADFMNSKFEKLNIDSSRLKKLFRSLKLNESIHKHILIFSLLEWSELQAPDLESEFQMKAASLRKIKMQVKKKLYEKDENYVNIMEQLRIKLGLY